MNWLLDFILLRYHRESYPDVMSIVEGMTPATIEEVDEDYVQLLQQFIVDSHFENENHMKKVGSYRMDLFLASEYAFMKMRTHVDGKVDPDSDEGQQWMFENYYEEFIESVTALMPSLSKVGVQDISTWQSQMQGMA